MNLRRKYDVNLNQQLDKDLNEKQLENFEPFFKRHSEPCTWDDFCRKLYKVLYSSKNGYLSTAKIVHELYKSHKIDAVTVSREQGFRCFEEMLRDPILAHVVVIETEQPSRANPDFTVYRYRAVLETTKFQDIRRNTPRSTNIDEHGFLYPFIKNMDDSAAKPQQQYEDDAIFSWSKNVDPKEDEGPEPENSQDPRAANSNTFVPKDNDVQGSAKEVSSVKYT